MMLHVSRRSFLAATPVSLAAIASAQPDVDPQTDDAPGDEYPTTPGDRASAFVGACHAQIDTVRSMLSEDAGLAKASWDWGFGDWETAIGAASHTGRLDIIELLLAHGARPTLFTLATLDRVDALRDLLEHVPKMDTIEGPHSIPLLRHAKAGKAQRVIEYLEGRGAKDENPFAIEEADAAPYVGVYTWSAGEKDRFELTWKNQSLSIKRPDHAGRNLIPLGDHAFSPAGARHVRIEFDIADGHAVRVHVPWAGTTLTAKLSG